MRIATVDIVFEGWSAMPRGAESTATIARRLISDLFGVVGGEVPTLAVESGPVRPSAVHLCDRDRRYLAGRADGCDLVLPSEHVSREHAVFIRHWDGVVVSDLGSKNGLLVNGIASSGPTKLADGDRIEVGPIVLGFTDPEDRYIRRLESLGNQAREGVPGIEISGSPPQGAVAVAALQPEVLPAAPSALEGPPVSFGAPDPKSKQTPARPATPNAAEENFQPALRPPKWVSKWVLNVLVATVVVVAVVGLVLLLFATR